jgi:hypothetical protein
MKPVMIFFGVICTLSMAVPSYANDKAGGMETMMHHHTMGGDTDSRTSLHLSPQVKQHQLANMRSHLEAVQAIVGLIAAEKFDEASDIAHNKLGLTPEMKKMCNMFGNDDFRDLGLAFHQSADELGNVLKTGDVQASLNALHTTMNSCVQCHATFRQ